VNGTEDVTSQQVIALVAELKADRDELLGVVAGLIDLIRSVSDSMALTDEVPAEVMVEIDRIAWGAREARLSNAREG
jgi:hypothetical protein